MGGEAVTTTGVIRNVTPRFAGTTLTATTGSGTTVLQVDDAADFEERFASEGYMLVLANETTPREYIAVSNDETGTETVTLADPVGAVFEAGLPVHLWDPSVEADDKRAVEYVASVQLEGERDDSRPIPALIQHEMIPLAGIYTLYGAQAVLRPEDPDDPDSGWEVVNIVNRQAVLDGSSIDPASFPPGSRGQTFSDDPPPATTAGFAEDHAWWQLRDGDTPLVWRAEGIDWVPVEVISGDAAYFQNALIEALQVTGLTAVSIDGGSIYIAGGTGASYPQAFSGTSLPAGWTGVETPTGAWVAPNPSVITSGYPSGGVGSVLLLSSGAAGQAPVGGAVSDSVVTPSYTVNDFELVMRYRTTVNNDADLFPKSAAFLDFNKNGGTYHRLNLRHTGVGITSGGSSVASNAGTPTGSQWINVRLRKGAGTIAVSAWRDGQTEPAPKTISPGAALADGSFEIALNASSIFGASDGNALYVDTFDVTELATGFKVNPDGTGEWPAIGLRQGDAAWSNVGGAGKPAYQNGWTATSGDGIAYRRTPTGDVTMVGRGTPGSANVAVFTLPAGYRPSRDLTDLITKAQGTGVFSTLDVLANGDVIARGTGSATWVSFTMSFPTS